MDFDEDTIPLARVIPSSEYTKYGSRQYTSPLGTTVTLYIWESIDIRQEHLINEQAVRNYCNSVKHATPLFYMQLGAKLLTRGPALSRVGLRVLSNMVELQLNDPHWMRLLGYACEQHALFEHALHLYKRVLTLRGEEPHSYLDLARVLVRRRLPGDLPRALALLTDVIVSLAVARRRNW